MKQRKVAYSIQLVQTPTPKLIQHSIACNNPQFIISHNIGKYVPLKTARNINNNMSSHVVFRKQSSVIKCHHLPCYKICSAILHLIRKNLKDIYHSDWEDHVLEVLLTLLSQGLFLGSVCVRARQDCGPKGIWSLGWLLECWLVGHAQSVVTIGTHTVPFWGGQPSVPQMVIPFSPGVHPKGLQYSSKLHSKFSVPSQHLKQSPKLICLTQFV